MQALESVISSNEAYRALQQSELDEAERTRLETTITVNLPVYHQMGDTVCQALVTRVAETENDPHYNGANFQAASYDPLSTAHRQESLDAVSARAFDALKRYADYALCQAAMSGDTEAQAVFVDRYHKLILKHVGAVLRHSGIHDPELARDLYQEGALFTLRRARDYLPDRGTRFSTHMSQFLPKYLHNLIAGRHAVQLPEPVRRIVEQVQKIDGERMAIGAVRMTDEEIAKKFKLPLGNAGGKVRTVGDIRQAVRLRDEMSSIDANMYGHDGDNAGSQPVVAARTVMESIFGNQQPSTDEAYHQRELVRKVRAVLQTLSEREQEIMEHLFGLNGRTQKDLKEVAPIYSLSSERIRQIRNDVLKRLRQQEHADILESHAD